MCLKKRKKWWLRFSSERCVTVIAMRVTTLLLWVCHDVRVFGYQALSYKYLTVSIILAHRVYEDVHKSELNKRPDDLRLTKAPPHVHVILVCYLLVTFAWTLLAWKLNLTLQFYMTATISSRNDYWCKVSVAEHRQIGNRKKEILLTRASTK